MCFEWIMSIVEPPGKGFARGSPLTKNAPSPGGVVRRFGVL
jgi:hypothetical protein